jgi:hypothetical protein
MALTFNGTSQYGRVANNANFNVTPSISIMAWVKTSLTTTLGSSMQRIAGRYLNSAAANEQYAIDLYMGMPRFMVGTNQIVTTVEGSSAATSNVWTHICGTYDGVTMNIYQDGELVGTLGRSGSINSSNGVFSFGADYNGVMGSEFFAGSMEDIRIYNRALSQAEIETIVTCRGTALIRNGMILNLQLDEQRTGAVIAAGAVIYDTGPLKMNATNVVANTTFSDGFLRKRRFS